MTRLTALRVRIRSLGLSHAALLALIGGCAASPPPVDEYSIDLPDHIEDGRSRFSDIYCAVLEARQDSLPYYLPCEEALTPVQDSPPATGSRVDLGPSIRKLKAAVVPGIGFSCFATWLHPPKTVAAHLQQFGFDQTHIEVDALSGSSTNARQIRDAILAMTPQEPPRLVLVGYSKGTADILEAVVNYPEIRGHIAAVVSIAGAVGGSPLASDARQWQADLLKYWPKSECDSGDGEAVASLRPDIRRAWLAENPLPDEVPYYSVVTLPLPERISRVIGPSYRKLGKIDWRNDSQVIYSDEFIPGSTLLGFINADHWAVAVPVNDAHPAIANRFVDQNQYPREALLEAILRFVEEDLESK